MDKGPWQRWCRARVEVFSCSLRTQVACVLPPVHLPRIVGSAMMTESDEAPLVRVLLRPFPLLREGRGAVGSEIGARVQRGQRVATRFAVGTGGVRRVGHISQARRSLRRARRAREGHGIVQRAAGSGPFQLMTVTKARRRS